VPAPDVQRESGYKAEQELQGFLLSLFAACWYYPFETLLNGLASLREVLLRRSMFPFVLCSRCLCQGLGAATLMALLCAPAHAGKVVLWIQAGNPVDEPNRVSIRSSLPERVKPEHIIDDGGLNIGYDIKKAVYYVHKDVELGPTETRDFRVEIQDIWIIPGPEVDALSARARALVGQLQGSEYHADMEALRREVESDLDGIRKSQAANAIPQAKPIQHIRAYESDLRTLNRAKRDIGRIENMVMALQKDPGGLVWGATEEFKSRRPVKLAAEDLQIAIIRITVENTSPTMTRRIPIQRDLPSEIKPADVVDSAGLEVGTDVNRGVCYVFKKDVEIGPGATVQFDVKIRDKWNVNGPRLDALRSAADLLLSRIRTKKKYKSVETAIEGLIAELDAIKAEAGPQTISESYVAFHRQQSATLDRIEQKIDRIESAMKPLDTRKGFDVPRPSPKTTWLIIYIILGFLAVVSLLFFLRWYGKTKAEQM